MDSTEYLLLFKASWIHSGKVLEFVNKILQDNFLTQMFINLDLPLYSVKGCLSQLFQAVQLWQTENLMIYGP